MHRGCQPDATTPFSLMVNIRDSFPSFAGGELNKQKTKSPSISERAFNFISQRLLAIDIISQLVVR